MTFSEKKIFGILFLSILSAITGVGIVIPLLPVYAHDLGASGLYISMIFGSFSISRSLFLPWFGKLSDRNGRKPFIAGGLFAYAVVSLGFMLSKSVGSLIVLRFFQGIGSAMVMPVAQAYVGDITPKGKEGFLMGLFSLAMFGSLSLGPFLGGVINRYYGLDWAFGAMGLLAITAFMFSFFMLPPVTEERASSTKTADTPWKTILRDREMTGLFIFRFVYTTCVGTIWCFLPLFADQAFHLSSAQTGTLVMVMVLAGGLFHTPMGIAADRFNKRVLVISGGLVIALAMLSCEWATGFYFLLVALTAFGIGGGIALPALSAMAVIKGKKITALASVLSLLTMAHSLGMLAGSLIAGLTMDYMELRHAFPISATMMTAGIIVFFRCTGKKDLRVEG